LSNGTGIGITGTYPNFTITNTLPSIGPSYSQILYVFSQSGSNDPSRPSTGTTLTALVNTTGTTIDFKRSTVGYYVVQAATTIFDQDRTAVILSAGTIAAQKGFRYSYEWLSQQEIGIYSFDNSAVSYDDIFVGATLDIRVY
jgi:hypothetical protein